MKLAAAPISWGVCEVPGWGVQLPLERVLADASRLGLKEIEAGPPGFLSPDAHRARPLLDARAMRIVGAFVTAVLHEQAALEVELLRIERHASHLEALRGSVLVLAAASGRDGYEAPVVLDRSEWGVLLGALPKVIAL